ncbi:sulfotransferase family protein [Marinobacter sp. OP 3.4]|uniref:sulfotransferase family protein n=1 Tax=Marinobacter sp. OP 3.4 TaxID=3076501 RepID=UPI002E1E41B7
MKQRPVFIIGAGRSGTKFLRDTLSVSPDVVRVPYDIGYLWRYGNERLKHDEIDPASVSDKSIQWMRNKLPHLAERDVQKAKSDILIEKSVPNSLRPLLLYRAFPDATFIHLVRDGRAVTESAIRMWQTPPEKGYLMDKIRYFPWGNFRYAFWYLWNRISGLFNNAPPIWGPRYKGIEEDVKRYPLHVVCAKQWFHCVRIAFDQLSQIPDSQVITIRYEELMDNADTIVSLCMQLGIDPHPVTRQYKDTLKTGENEKWRQGLSEDQQSEILRIFEELPATIKEYVFCEASI